MIQGLRNLLTAAPHIGLPVRRHHASTWELSAGGAHYSTHCWAKLL